MLHIHKVFFKAMFNVEITDTGKIINVLRSFDKKSMCYNRKENTALIRPFFVCFCLLHCEWFVDYLHFGRNNK